MTKFFFCIVLLTSIHVGASSSSPSFSSAPMGSIPLVGAPGYGQLMQYDGTAGAEMNAIKMALHPHIVNAIQGLGADGNGMDFTKAGALADASIKLYGPASPEMAEIRGAMHPQLMNAIQGISIAGDVGTATTQISSIVDVTTKFYGSSAPASYSTSTATLSKVGG